MVATRFLDQIVSDNRLQICGANGMFAISNSTMISEWSDRPDQNYGSIVINPACGDAMKRTFTPDLASSLEASSASKGAGMGTTGRSFVDIPLCCRDMCECREFLDLATVPQRTQRYPGHT